MPRAGKRLSGQKPWKEPHKDFLNAYQFRKEEERYSMRVSMERIEKEGYNLNISRYISTAQAAEEIDTARDKHNAFLKELGLPLCREQQRNLM